MTAPRAMPTPPGGESTVADVMHAEFTALAPTATVGDVSDWLAGGASRRLALIVDRGRYVGSLMPADAAGGLPRHWPAVQLARYGRTVSPDMTAAEGRDEVLQSAARRVAVVDDDGRLCGVLALTTDARHFSCASETSNR